MAIIICCGRNCIGAKASMLETLFIENLITIDTLELSFEKGFTALTGETGAGKSLLFDALQLLSGAKASTWLLRPGALKAQISAVFKLDDLAAAQNWLKEEAIDEDVCIIRRVIEASKSRASINGVAVTLQQLRALGERLFALFGQNEFLSAFEQRSFLDRYAHIEEEAKKLSALWYALQEARSQIKTIESQTEVAAVKREILLRETEELKQALPAEEWQRISQAHQRALNATILLEGALEARDILADTLMPKLNQAKQRLGKLKPFDSKLSEILNLLEQAEPSLEEAYDTLLHYCEHLEFDPDQLQQLDTLVLLHEALAKKYKVPPEALFNLLLQKKKELAALEENTSIEEWQKKEEILWAQYEEKALSIRQARKEAGKDIEGRVARYLGDLFLAHVVFRVEVRSASPGPAGMDEVIFLVRTNAGLPEAPLATAASGGELARIALALALALAEKVKLPTLLFDEIDVGVGGKVAYAIGALLRRLGQKTQVLAVTHAAQVAACAHNHYHVTKSNDSTDGQALTLVNLLKGDARVEELARMMGGAQVTETTKQHARELLLAGSF